MAHDPEQPGARDERSEQERARAYREQLKQVHGVDLGYEMALSAVSFGSQKLGLTEATAELRDLEDARLAIELLRALLDVLESQGGGAPAGELRETLAQLQLAYVQVLQLEQVSAAAETAAPEAAEESPAAPTDAPQPEEGAAPSPDETPAQPDDA
jgi:hypothetical protein